MYSSLIHSVEIVRCSCRNADIKNKTILYSYSFFKYRRYFNRRACVSVCLCSVCVLSVLQKIIEIGLVNIVYTPVLSTTWLYVFFKNLL